jgi:hypothetical protein
MPNFSSKSKQNSTASEQSNIDNDGHLCTVTTQPRRHHQWEHNELKPESSAPIAREQLQLF